MGNYIIFHAEKDQPHWEGRKLAHNGRGTFILAENFHGDDTPPKIGDRITEYVKVEECIDPDFPGASTHYKTGDWEVCRIEEYVPDIPISGLNTFTSIFICHCRYSPLDAPLKPMPSRIISLDSFGGDEKAYQKYMESKTVLVC
jgi:hypothetical protein